MNKEIHQHLSVYMNKVECPAFHTYETYQQAYHSASVGDKVPDPLEVCPVLEFLHQCG